jgi:hypothetical protein
VRSAPGRPYAALQTGADDDGGGGCARRGYEGMKRGSTVVIPGVWNKLIASAGELPPRRIALEVNRWLLGAYS